MKRYSFRSTVTITENPHQIERTAVVDSVMAESQSGEYVLWDDVEKIISELEFQIPEKRIAKLERMLGLVSEGKCPECCQKIRDFKPPTGSFAPEAWATLKEMNINPANGHKFGCSIGRKEGK